MKKSKNRKRKNQSRKIGRREFIKKSGQAGLAIAGLASGCVSTPKTAREPAMGPKTGQLSSSGGTSYDFIVVGSGAGGGPLAARLAQKYKVLLLEAGEDKNPVTSSVPGYHPLATDDDSIAWKFFVEHYSREDRRTDKWDSKYQMGKPGQLGKGILYPRAATLGGCTAHNAMIALCPDNDDWNQLASGLKDPSWSAENMRKYWQLVERNRYIPYFSRDYWENPGRMGWKGWLSTELSLEQASFGELKETALDDMIFSMGSVDGRFKDVEELVTNPSQFDPNQWNQVENRHDGMYAVPKSTYDGIRSGVRDRLKKAGPNLTIKTGCLVTRLKFDDNDPSRIRGVYYLPKTHIYQADMRAKGVDPSSIQEVPVEAAREVILSGGAFNSPQLLMLSGIGDPAHLTSMGITPRIALPGVGLNLQDRYEVGVVTELKKNMKFNSKCIPVPSDPNAAFNPNDPCLKDFKRLGAHSLYGSNGVVISMIKRSDPKTKNVPDLCIFGIPGFFRGYYPGWSRDSYTKNNWTWAILKGHTTNQAGTVRLKSNKPWDTPEICFNYFEDGDGDWQDDMNAVLEGIKTVRAINGSPRAGNVVSREAIPGDKYTGDGELQDFVKRESWGHHASCSNKMGLDPDGKEMAVVDKDFRVHKTKGLRVVDASVFPKIPGLFIVVPIYMISEKAADVIDQQQNS